jgi:DNA polymerase-3 subunit epsilon
MSKHYSELSDGYPDILVIEGNRLRFEEVKAPGDQLRRNQLIVIQKLKRLGWDVSIQTVEWKLNPQQPYVVVDIETTGGGQGNHRITEIGMVKVVEGKTIDTWQSLINPQRHIPKFITELTGISNDMVIDAPVFAEVASEVADFCEGCIFVAHNVNFDYGFFKQEFERLEQSFRLPKLCTVRLAKRHLPGHDSYSLGRICKDLGIQLENHHRALDDAKAAAELLLMVNEVRSNPHK